MINSSDLSRCVRQKDERSQILHHASVYQFDNIIFIIGDSNAGLIHVDIVNFNQHIINSYLQILDEMKEMALSWAYHDHNRASTSNTRRRSTNLGDRIEHPDLEEIVLPLAKLHKNIGGSNEFLSYFYLWKKLTFCQDHPVIPLKRIIPLTHSIWNMSKSGSDVCTKIIESHRFNHPCPNTNSRASSRILQLSYVSIQRFLQISRCNVNKYKSVRQLKNTSSKRFSYDRVLTLLVKYCRRRLFLGSNQGITDTVVSSNSNMMSPRTGDTPTLLRKRKRVDEIDHSHPFWKRVQNCWENGGHAVAIDTTSIGGDSKRPKCFFCDNKTKWYCLKCHRFLCNNPISIRQNEKKKRNKGKIKSVDAYTKNSNTITYVETCFGKCHYQGGGSEMNLSHLFEMES